MIDVTTMDIFIPIVMLTESHPLSFDCHTLNSGTCRASGQCTGLQVGRPRLAGARCCALELCGGKKNVSSAFRLG